MRSSSTGRAAMVAAAAIGVALSIWVHSAAAAADTPDAQSATAQAARNEDAASTVSPAVLPPNIPVRRDAPSSPTSAMELSLSWLAVLSVLGVAGYWALLQWEKKRGSDSSAAAGPLRLRWPGRSGASDLQVISSIRLTPRHSAHVVEWRGRRLLLGCAEQSVSVLAEAASMPPAPDIAQTASASAAANEFGSAL